MHWGSDIDSAEAAAQYAIATASMFALASALLNIGEGHKSVFSSGALSQWVLAFAVIMGQASAAIMLTEINTSLDLDAKDATMLWVANNLMRWFFCSAFALATITQ